MSKVTSKYQVHPGDEIDWVAAGDVIRVNSPEARAVRLETESRLRLFDQASERLRITYIDRPQELPFDRGWTKEDIYGCGRSN